MCMDSQCNHEELLQGNHVFQKDYIHEQKLYHDDHFYQSPPLLDYQSISLRPLMTVPTPSLTCGVCFDFAFL